MPKIVDREQYRKQLLKESFELFAEIGYGQITMRQLAQRLKISTGTLYHYFPSKEAIFLQLVEEQVQQDISNFTIHTESVPMDIRSRIRAILDFVRQDIDYFSKQLLLWMDYYQQQGGGDDESRLLFDRLDRETIVIINSYLQIDNYSIGEFILTFVNGLILCQIYHPNLSSWDTQVDILVEAIVAMNGK